MDTPNARPNIVFFFSDQQRWDTVGAYGQPLDVTPNLDRMAAEGVRFEQAFTCQPVCGPARACLQTGKWATEVGCYRNGIALPRDVTTLADLLHESGYETAYIGKWHLASTHGQGAADVDYRTKPVPPERRGGYRDHWVAADVLEFTSHSYDGGMFAGDGTFRPFSGYRADGQTDFVLEYLRQRRGDRPFFLFLSYIEPHHQNDHNCYEGPHGSKERFANFVPPPDLVDHGGDWRENYPDYLGCCASLDANLGRIRDQLAALGLAENTLIIYTSDHGSHFRTRNGEYKRSCHDGCLRIPLIVNGPGFSGGRVIPELVSLIDLPKTVLTAAGARVPGDWRGNPLQDLVHGTAASWPQDVFAQISESHVGRTIRTRKWKYAVGAPGIPGGKVAAANRYVETFLYDLENDPHEQCNLVADPRFADVRQQLRRRLLERLREAGEAAAAIEPAAVQPSPTGGAL